MLSIYMKIYSFVFGLSIGEGSGAVESSPRPEERPEGLLDAHNLQNVADELRADGVNEEDIMKLVYEATLEKDGLTEKVTDGERGVILGILESLGAENADGNSEIYYQAFGRSRRPVNHSIVADRNDGLIWDSKDTILSNPSFQKLIEKVGLTPLDVETAIVSGMNKADQASLETEAEEQRIQEEADLLAKTEGAHQEYAESRIEGERMKQEQDEMLSELRLTAADYFDGVTEFEDISDNRFQAARQIAESLGFTPVELEQVGLSLDDAIAAYNSAKNTRLAKIDDENALLARENATDEGIQRLADFREEQADENALLARENATDEGIQRLTDYRESLELEDKNLEGMLALLSERGGQLKFSTDVEENTQATAYIQEAMLAELGLDEIKHILGRPDMTEKRFVDGEYGNWTETVVANYQEKNGLEIDGSAGTETFAKLLEGEGVTYDTTTRIASIPLEAIPTIMMAEDTTATSDSSVT